MRLKKTRIASEEKFAAFLKNKFGITNLKSFQTDHSKRPDINQFYSALDKDGRKIFIKATTETHLVIHEYNANKHLHHIAPAHFPQAIAYYTKSPYAFCATDFVEGIALGELRQSADWNDALRIQAIENIYAIFLAMKKGDVVHRDIHANQMIYFMTEKLN